MVRTDTVSIEEARILLNDAKLPIKLWVEVVGAMPYIELDRITPQEKFSKPSVKHQIIFGSYCSFVIHNSFKKIRMLNFLNRYFFFYPLHRAEPGRDSPFRGNDERPS